MYLVVIVPPRDILLSVSRTRWIYDTFWVYVVSLETTGMFSPGDILYVDMLPGGVWKCRYHSYVDSLRHAFMYYTLPATCRNGTMGVCLTLKNPSRPGR